MTSSPRFFLPTPVAPLAGRLLPARPLLAAAFFSPLASSHAARVTSLEHLDLEGIPDAVRPRAPPSRRGRVPSERIAVHMVLGSIVLPGCRPSAVRCPGT